MINKGQIVEIPSISLIYKREVPCFSSKKEELEWRCSIRKYSLFDGFLVGEHSGFEHFKIGQRKGINVGGKKLPLYVIGIDKADNRIFVGAGKLHPGLWIKIFCFPTINIEWLVQGKISSEELIDGISVTISSPMIEDLLVATFYSFEADSFLIFEKPISVIIENYPISIMRQDEVIANIKTI